jgi:hypothetical protein
MTSTRLTLSVVATAAATALLSTAVPSVSGAQGHHARQGAHAHTLVDNLPGGGFGSTIGPGGDLFVTEPRRGAVARIDRHTGAVTTYVTGLPKQNPDIGLGGPTDVIFRRGVAYVLVTLVSPDVGGSDVDGIYRVNGPHHSTVVADIGSFAIAHPPGTPFDVPSGLQYALERYGHGFLVSDGHHNRVYGVRPNGGVRIFRGFSGDVVPTGMDVRHGAVYLSQAGPVPHHPWRGKIVRFHDAGDVQLIAKGAPLLTDVERGRTGLYAVSQGHFPGGPAGSPAAPNTGSVVRATAAGGFVKIVCGLNRPTSIEIVRNTGYVTTLGGDVIKINRLGAPPGC